MRTAPTVPAGCEPRMDVDTRPGAHRPFCLVWAPPEMAHLTVAELRSGAVPYLLDLDPFGPEPSLDLLPAVAVVLEAGGAVVEGCATMDELMRARWPYAGGGA